MKLMVPTSFRRDNSAKDDEADPLLGACATPLPRPGKTSTSRD